MACTVVVGGGIVGLFCAYELARHGEDVVIVDQSYPGGACSSGNAGWIVPSLSGPVPAPGLTLRSLLWMLGPNSPLHISPKALPGLLGWLWEFSRHCKRQSYTAGLKAVAALNRVTMAAYDALERDGVEFEMHRHGLLFAFLNESSMHKFVEDFQVLHSFGYSLPQPLRGAQLTELEPLLSDNVQAGFLVKEERHVRPETLCQGLVRRLSAMGVQIRPETAVIDGVRRVTRLVSVLTEEGEIEADRFLIAAGAWSGFLTAKLGWPIPLQAGKGYSLTIDRPTSIMSHPAYLYEARVGCTPLEGSLRLAGTMELSGINSRLDMKRIAAMRHGAAKYLRGNMQDSNARPWVGMRPLTPDGLPIIGRLPGFDNVFVATGHAMLGVTLAPATALAISDLILRGQTRLDLTSFDPSRFLSRWWLR